MNQNPENRGEYDAVEMNAGRHAEITSCALNQFRNAQQVALLGETPALALRAILIVWYVSSYKFRNTLFGVDGQ